MALEGRAPSVRFCGASWARVPGAVAVLGQLGAGGGGPGWDVLAGGGPGPVMGLLSVSPVVAQRLRKPDFPAKDSEEPSAPGADKNRFLRARGPEEDPGKVSAMDTWAAGARAGWPAWRGAAAGGRRVVPLILFGRLIFPANGVWF